MLLCDCYSQEHGSVLAGQFVASCYNSSLTVCDQFLRVLNYIYFAAADEFHCATVCCDEDFDVSLCACLSACVHVNCSVVCLCVCVCVADFGPPSQRERERVRR